MQYRALGAILGVSLLLATGARAQGWSRFRGPNGSGTSETTGLPSSFGPEENLRWRTAVAPGLSSPVLGDGTVFLTAADELGLLVECIDSEKGDLRWERRIERTHKLEVFPANGSATPSPTTDGQNVYAFFPEFGLVSFDAKGEERWRLPLGPFVSFYGMAASPILAADALLLLCDQQQGSYLLAVDAAKGMVRWRTERQGMIESWTTPVLLPTGADPKTIVVFGSFFVCGYSVQSGKELWRHGGLGYTPVCSPVVGGADGSRVFASVPFHAEEPMPEFAGLSGSFDADKDGKLTKAELSASEIVGHFGWVDANKDAFIDQKEWDFVNAGMSSRDYGLVAFEWASDAKGLKELWRYKRGLPSIATPLLLNDVLYLVKHGGMLTTLDTATGDTLAFERLKDGEGDYDASPVSADGKVFLANTEGRVIVIAAGREPKVLARCELGEAIHATPAIGNGAIFVRTEKSLYCFARTDKN